MRFVRKQYCWNRQALRHAEAMSGYDLAIIICLVSPHLLILIVDADPLSAKSWLFLVHPFWLPMLSSQRMWKHWIVSIVLANFVFFSEITWTLTVVEAAPVDLRSQTCQHAHGLQVCPYCLVISPDRSRNSTTASRRWLGFYFMLILFTVYDFHYYTSIMP